MEQVLRTLLPFMLGGLILSQIGQRLESIRDAGVRRAARFCTQWVIWVAMPSLVLTRIHALPSFSLSDPQVFLPVSQPWLHFLAVYWLMGWLAKRYQWTPAARGALTITVGLGNTSFVGIPLLNAILGPGAIPTGILLDQLGSFLILTTTGIALARAFRAESQGLEKARRRKRDWILNPVKFPPFAALLLALVLRPFPYPDIIETTLTGLASTLTPAALLSVGLSIRLSALKRPEVRTLLALGLGLKLFMLPLLEGLLYSGVIRLIPDFDPLVRMTLLLEASMATMIMAGVVAADSELEPDLSQLMVGASIPISLLTVPAWHYFWG